MKPLGELEAVVMERLWAADGPLAVREVQTDLAPERPLAYTTVMTVLDHLHRKGYVTREKQGKAYRYSSTTSRDEHAAELLGQALASSGDRGAALMHFVGRMAPEEVAQLRAALTDLDPDDTGRDEG